MKLYHQGFAKRVFSQICEQKVGANKRLVVYKPELKRESNREVKYKSGYYFKIFEAFACIELCNCPRELYLYHAAKNYAILSRKQISMKTVKKNKLESFKTY